MNEPVDPPVRAMDDPWHALRALTPARIALGRSGAGLPTVRHLDLQLAHARAHDAVWRPFDATSVEEQFRSAGHTVLRVRSAARDRAEYLARPDLGRRIAPAAADMLAAHAGAWDVGFVVGDGLAPLAAERYASTVVRELIARLDDTWRVAPIVISEQTRVAVGDQIGAVLGLRTVVMLLGERPGMSAHDSLGAYVTLNPGPGTMDAQRNCVSNIRTGALLPAIAADVLCMLLVESRRQRVTGVALRLASVTTGAMAISGSPNASEPPC